MGKGHPEATRFPKSSACWGRNLLLAVCKALPSPRLAASARKRVCLMRASRNTFCLFLFRCLLPKPCPLFAF